MSRRRLSPDEHALWKGVTRSIRPLRRRAAVADPEIAPSEEPAPKPKVKVKPIALSPPPAPPKPPPRLDPTPLGRKAKRRLSRGADEIHGRLDLHGMTQAQAHGALLHFLRVQQARGAKLVLVITGKGGVSAEGSGVLKRQVPHWLRLPDFRDAVIGFESAGKGHGGEGAMYVRIRRARD